MYGLFLSGNMAPSKDLVCEGLQACLEMIEAQTDAERIFLLCCASIDPETGKPWCPDCRAAEPVINGLKSLLKPGDVYILCRAYDKQTWKDPNNEFRSHPKFLMKTVPSLWQWGKPMRIEDEAAADAELVTKLFQGQD